MCNPAGMRKPDLCTQNTPIHIMVCIRIKYLLYIFKVLKKSVSSMRFLSSLKSKILCAHKPYFLMSAHNYIIEIRNFYLGRAAPIMLLILTISCIFY